MFKKLRNERGSFLFGGGGGSSPRVVYQPTEVKEDKKKLKKLRTALFMTEGGSAGEEVMEGGTSTRDTLFGN